MRSTAHHDPSIPSVKSLARPREV
jgi:hypothetical protein